MKQMSRKRVKRKSKHKNNEKSKIVSTNADLGGISAQDEPRTPDSSSKCTKKTEKSARQVHIAFLPDKYQPLVEDETADEPPDDYSQKKQDKYKKIRKNVGKALRYSWKCLVVGLQNLSTAYLMPLSATVTIVPDIQRARAHV